MKLQEFIYQSLSRSPATFVGFMNMSIIGVFWKRYCCKHLRLRPYIFHRSIKIVRFCDKNTSLWNFPFLEMTFNSLVWEFDECHDAKSLKLKRCRRSWRTDLDNAIHAIPEIGIVLKKTVDSKRLCIHSSTLYLKV